MPDSLRRFLQYEAEFRLIEIHEVPEKSITNDLITEVAETLYDHEIFDYDYIDKLIWDVLEKKGIER